MGRALAEFRHELRAAMTDAGMTLDQLTARVAATGPRVGRSTLGNALLVTQPAPRDQTVDAFIRVLDPDGVRGWRLRWEQLRRTEPELLARHAGRTGPELSVAVTLPVGREARATIPTTENSPTAAGEDAPSPPTGESEKSRDSIDPADVKVGAARAAAGSVVEAGADESAAGKGRKFALPHLAAAALVGAVTGSAATWGAVTAGRPEVAVPLVQLAPTPSSAPTPIPSGELLNKSPVGICDKDMEVLAQRDIANVARIKLVWSPSCNAVWAHYRRLDDRAKSTGVELAVYERENSSRRLSTSGRDVSSWFTYMLPRHEGSSGMCVSATVYTDGRAQSLPEPVC